MKLTLGNNTRLKLCLLLTSGVMAASLVNLAYGQSYEPVIIYDESSAWGAPRKDCAAEFECKRDLTTGSDNNSSMRFSTAMNGTGRWSWVTGEEIANSAGKEYRVSSHMKLNEWATQSHIAFEGFNKTSGQWYQLIQCPSGVDGPSEWREWNCRMRVPEDTISLRPTFNAGWSSKGGEIAITWFDAITITALDKCRIIGFLSCFHSQKLPPINDDFSQQIPLINDTSLRVQSIIEGLVDPTDMAFVDVNSILVLEKDGQVKHVSNGVIQEQPALQLLVNTDSERGLVGIVTLDASRGEGSNTKDVFLYFTEGDPLRNRVYKYQWNGQFLVNPRLILDLPAQPGDDHNGGKLVIGPDAYLYTVIGDVRYSNYGQLQNIPSGPQPDNTSVIFRVSPENGTPAPDNPLEGGDNLLKSYYAYGIRNSFGLDFDPLTGLLWNTENGRSDYDEINLVQPGFNSGWKKVMGPISRTNISESDLIHFDGSHYSDPEFSWYFPIGVTDIEFLKSDRLGDRYTNNIFVGDFNNGNLYFFEVNNNRTGLMLGDKSANTQALMDLVADSREESAAVIFGSGFEGITDIETGPDGFLYVLTYHDGQIHKISPR